MKFSVLTLYLISILVLEACSKQLGQTKTIDFVPPVHQGQTMAAPDTELLQQVDKFVGGQPESKAVAWSWLENQTRNKLIESLLRLQHSIPRDDPRYLEIAFVLCNFDYDYQTNRQFITLALTNDRKKDIPPDLVADLIIRLVQRGDRDLLHDLFVATNWADGAMSEDLSQFFIKEMVDTPAEFLVKLAPESRATRYKVYRLIVNKTTLTTNDAMKMKAFLTGVGTSSEIYPLAKEMSKMLNRYRAHD